MIVPITINDTVTARMGFDTGGNFNMIEMDSSFCAARLYGLGIALRENIKTRKFSRGASTITMQVVRNIFLTHNRNLVRKVEESILALLLENYYKIEKKSFWNSI